MGSWFSRRDFLPVGLKAEQVELDGNRTRVHARSSDASAACPRCGTVSCHAHSKYWRRATDLAAHGREVELALLVRRFHCRAVGCPTKIFSERFLPAVTRPHARRTSRLQKLVRYIAIALGGRTAQALAGRLLLPVRKDTFLSRVRTKTERAVAAPRVVGIDDWAWRKVIDLLPDREPATVEAWLRARTWIEGVARDRTSGYGGAATRALPDSIQVADRWHLLENGSAAFLAAVQRNMPAIRKVIG